MIWLFHSSGINIEGEFQILVSTKGDNNPTGRGMTLSPSTFELGQIWTQEQFLFNDLLEYIRK